MNKKILLLASLLLISFIGSPVQAVTKNFDTTNLNNNIVYNPFQGLGICHASMPELLDDPIISWSYDSGSGLFWSNIEPVEGQFNWESVDNLIRLHESKGKKLWLQIYNTQGAVPEWAKTKLINGKKMQMMGQDNPPNNCSTMNPSQPLLWDEIYLSLWQKVIRALAQRYDDNPTVEAIIVMGGGGYGEMVVCSTCGQAYCWAKYAGCTGCESCDIWNCSSTCVQCVDNKFAQGVKNIVDLYLFEFQNKPVILQLGNGLAFTNHGTASVIKPVADYLIPKYGMRVLLKTNGWHNGEVTPPASCNNGHAGIINYFLDASRPERTKYGLEPSRPTNDLTTETGMIQCRDAASYGCLQPWYWGLGDADPNNRQKFNGIRTSLAKSLGSKVAIKEIVYPDNLQTGLASNFTATLINSGDIPPFRPQRQGIKDLPGSYLLSWQLLKDNQVIWQTDLLPDPGSNIWPKNRDLTFTQAITLPNYLFTDEYELRLGLFDPEAKTRARQEYFRFLNKDLLDPQGRAKISLVAITGLPATCTTRVNGDMNCDGKTDQTDLDVLAKHWGITNSPADTNSDNLINETDLNKLLQNWTNPS